MPGWEHPTNDGSQSRQRGDDQPQQQQHVRLGQSGDDGGAAVSRAGPASGAKRRWKGASRQGHHAAWGSDDDDAGLPRAHSRADQGGMQASAHSSSGGGGGGGGLNTTTTSARSVFSVPAGGPSTPPLQAPAAHSDGRRRLDQHVGRVHGVRRSVYSVLFSQQQQQQQQQPQQQRPRVGVPTPSHTDPHHAPHDGGASEAEQQQHGGGSGSPERGGVQPGFADLLTLSGAGWRAPNSSGDMPGGGGGAQRRGAAARGGAAAQHHPSCAHGVQQAGGGGGSGGGADYQSMVSEIGSDAVPRLAAPLQAHPAAAAEAAAAAARGAGGAAGGGGNFLASVSNLIVQRDVQGGGGTAAPPAPAGAAGGGAQRRRGKRSGGGGGGGMAAAASSSALSSSRGVMQMYKYYNEQTELSLQPDALNRLLQTLQSVPSSILGMHPTAFEVELAQKMLIKILSDSYARHVKDGTVDAVRLTTYIALSLLRDLIKNPFICVRKTALDLVYNLSVHINILQNQRFYDEPSEADLRGAANVATIHNELVWLLTELILQLVQWDEDAEGVWQNACTAWLAMTANPLTGYPEPRYINMVDIRALKRFTQVSRVATDEILFTKIVACIHTSLMLSPSDASLDGSSAASEAPNTTASPQGGASDDVPDPACAERAGHPQGAVSPVHGHATGLPLLAAPAGECKYLNSSRLVVMGGWRAVVGLYLDVHSWSGREHCFKILYYYVAEQIDASGVLRSLVPSDVEKQTLDFVLREFIRVDLHFCLAKLFARPSEFSGQLQRYLTAGGGPLREGYNKQVAVHVLRHLQGLATEYHRPPAVLYGDIETVVQLSASLASADPGVDAASSREAFDLSMRQLRTLCLSSTECADSNAENRCLAAKWLFLLIKTATEAGCTVSLSLDAQAAPAAPSPLEVAVNSLCRDLTQSRIPEVRLMYLHVTEAYLLMVKASFSEAAAVSALNQHMRLLIEHRESSPRVLMALFHLLIETLCSVSNDLPSLRVGSDGIADMLLLGALEVPHALLMRVHTDLLLDLFRDLLATGKGGCIHRACHAVLLLIVAQVTFDKSLLPAIGDREFFAEVLDAMPTHTFRPLMLTAATFVCSSVAESEPHMWRSIVATLPPNSEVTRHPYHLAKFLLKNMKPRERQQQAPPPM